MYVVVLMLPLAFAALVWPARRVWAIRAVELLVALILSKFAIVAVLSLGGAALGHTAFPSAAEMLGGATLVMLAAFAPWALLRLLPLHELTSGSAGFAPVRNPLPPPKPAPSRPRKSRRPSCASCRRARRMPAHRPGTLVRPRQPSARWTQCSGRARGERVGRRREVDGAGRPAEGDASGT